MTDGGFVSIEGTTSNRDSFGILLRFLGSLTLLKRLLPVTILLLVMTTAAPQIFLWLTGEYSQCIAPSECFARIPFLGQSLGLTPELLAWVALGSAALRLFCWALFEISGQWAAQGIHRKMVSAVAHTRTTFFDENPSGRLINRLVRDFDNLRTTGVVRISDTIYTLTEAMCVSALVFLAHPIGAILIVPTILFFFYAQRQISPMLQRCATIKSARFSEVLHRETDVIEGARTFQLYGKECTLLERLQSALNRFIQINLVRAEVESWGRFWTASITTLYSFTTLAAVGAAVHYGTISSILGAVIITVIFRLSPLFSWLTWTTSYLVESIATARRVFEYVDLPDELDEEFAPSAARPLRLTLAQPPTGDIEIENFTMSYRPALPIILDNISLKLPFGAHIGIIGRTGSGKTSIVQSLLRMVYVHGGDILVGGVSIFSLPVDMSRSLFSVVPQDPYLFEGTIRSNLDRTGSVTTARLQNALEDVGLTASIDAAVAEGGKNLSVGERQLVCLARAIVMNRPYILMDEPTSSVDSITDQRMHEALFNRFKGKTIITIAHRLQTLESYDLLVELSAGRVVRTGHPSKILPHIPTTQG
jgi:ABC-type multidrug transport system fused ATPase/permease subunit